MCFSLKTFPWTRFHFAAAKLQSFVLWKIQTGADVCSCIDIAFTSMCFFLPFFPVFVSCAQHNPSIYEITKAHLCSSESHLGSKEASTGNHLGSVLSSFPSPPLSPLHSDQIYFLSKEN